MLIVVLNINIRVPVCLLFVELGSINPCGLDPDMLNAVSSDFIEAQ